MSKAMTRNKEGREEIRKGLVCQREEYGLDHVGTQEPQRTVGSGHPSQVCFKRAPQVPCGGWVCGWERPEAGDPIVRVQERADKARAGGEWSGFQGTLSMLWRQRERRGWRLFRCFLLGSLTAGGDIRGDRECGFGVRGNGHVSVRYLRVILEGKQVIAGAVCLEVRTLQLEVHI